MTVPTLIEPGMDFESLYRAHFACVWRALRRFGVADKDATDLTQEVFLTACRRLENFEARSSVKTWLIGIAYGLAANYRRNASTRREVLEGDWLGNEPCGEDSQERLEQREQLRQLERVLLAMPLDQRAVLTMFEMEGLTGEEIADVLQIPLGTVRSRLRHARVAFLEAVGELRQGTPALARGVEP